MATNSGIRKIKINPITLTQQLRRKIQLKNESISLYLKNLTAEKDTNYFLWKTTNRLKRPMIHYSPIKIAGGHWVRDSINKAETFAKYLEATF